MDKNKSNSARKTNTYDVYVGHVPKNIEKGKLEQVFSKYGVLVDVLYRFGNGTYGYAIVKFKYEKDADAVLTDINRIEVDGHEMDVKRGKMSNQNVENVNENTIKYDTMTEIVPQTESNIPFMEKSHFKEPVLYDSHYSAYISNGNEPIPVMIEILCTNVVNSVVFHGCIVSKLIELENFAIKLNSICPNLQRVLRKPQIRKVYGALYDDMNWYRCSVIQCTIPSKPGVCIAQYIDFGGISEVCYSNMVELPEPLKNATPFAIKCVFSNLVSTSKSHNNITYLHHLVDKRMSLYAVSLGNEEYQVIKCSCNGIDVIGELVRNGFAIYKTKMFANSPPLPKKPNKITSPKIQENRNSRKSSKTNAKVGESINSKKKVNDAGSDSGKCLVICNDVNMLSEISNSLEKIEENEMTKNLSFDEAQVQEFTPKKIVKRGNDTTDVMNISFIGVKNVSQLLKMDCVISNLKLVNNIRSLFPIHTDDDLINNAINLLQNEIDRTETNDTKEPVEEYYRKYCDTLDELRKCINQDCLADLKKKREEERIQLLNKLEYFFENFDYSLIERKKKFQEVIMALESNSNAWMNVYLPEPPKTLENLLIEYNQEKEKRKNVIQKTRENTNEKYKKFEKLFFEDLRKEFQLNMVDKNTNETYFVNTGGKRGSWQLKFEEALTDLDNALEEESNMSTRVKDRSHVSVIDFILKKLDIPKEKIDAKCELLEKYKTLYDDLNFTLDFSPIFTELYALRKDIKAMSFNCVFNGDKEKMNNLLLKLHTALLQEDALLKKLAKASVLHFPEIILEHPDFKLDEYQKHSSLLKFSWEDKFFPVLEKCNRIEPAYISKLANESVVIKEFQVSSSEKKVFIEKAVAWNEIRSNSLVKLKAIFLKDENTLYTVLSPVWETLCDKPMSTPVDYKMALKLLQKILAGLCDLHSRGIAHGAVHPLAILQKDDEILLDFNFDKKYLENRCCVNGINFQVPSAEDLYKSADMYGFGCLVLWVLFPNLSFSSTDQGVPNLNSFQSIIQEVLSAKDFASLSALLNFNQDLRPSSRVLLSNGFLRDLRIMS